MTMTGEDDAKTYAVRGHGFHGIAGTYYVLRLLLQGTCTRKLCLTTWEC